MANLTKGPTVGIEAVKIMAPLLGIPIKICKRLYEIYDRNRKQLLSR